MTFSKLKFILPLLVLLFTPALASSALVSCDNCTFDQVYPMINKLVEFLLILAVPVGGVVIAIGGFFILSNMGNPGRISEGWSIIKAAVIGLVIAFAGWLIIKTILYSLGAGWVSGIL